MFPLITEALKIRMNSETEFSRKGARVQEKEREDILLMLLDERTS